MIVVRALVWRSMDGYESSQVQIMKLHDDFLGHENVLSRFCFAVDVDLKRNTIDKVERLLDISPRMHKTSEVDEGMLKHIETILTSWSKKEDLFLGQNKEKESNPWIFAGIPFFCNVFISPRIRTSVPASHPDILPILTMCASSMATAFVGMDQHMVESELLAHFNSLVVQARRESTRSIYGDYP